MLLSELRTGDRFPFIDELTHCCSFEQPPRSSRVFAMPVEPRPGRRGRLRASCQALFPDSPSYHHIFHRGLGKSHTFFLRHLKTNTHLPFPVDSCTENVSQTWTTKEWFKHHMYFSFLLKKYAQIRFWPSPRCLVGRSLEHWASLQRVGRQPSPFSSTTTCYCARRTTARPIWPPPPWLSWVGSLWRRPVSLTSGWRSTECREHSLRSKNRAVWPT